MYLIVRLEEIQREIEDFQVQLEKNHYDAEKEKEKKSICSSIKDYYDWIVRRASPYFNWNKKTP